jgi:hypothetical protein
MPAAFARRFRPRLAALFAFVLLAATAALLPAAPAHAAPALLSQGKPVTSSSVENGGTVAANAVDGNQGTRWSSAFSDPQWIRVDLGATVDVSKVVLHWETAYARSYRIEFSGNGTDWTTAYSTTAGTGGTETVSVSGSARYVRMYGTERGTQWGYSLWEFQVYGTAGGGGDIQGGGDLGPNVIMFNPSMPMSQIQSTVDAVFQKQESAQFGDGRYQFLFAPGDYSGLNIQLGFYTSISGLGKFPDDTMLNGDITVDAGWFNGNATQNFWRSAENMAIRPVSGSDRWAVAQAAPFRRMHVLGGLNLAPSGYGWASGGYIANSKIDGTVTPYSQQQWYTRDSSIGGWGNGVWNMVFSGVEGAPAQSFPDPPYTTLPTTPISREKPFLYSDGGQYKVFAPAKRVNARGTTWADGTLDGESIPLSQFYVAKPGVSAATINAALDQGLNLLLTPGIYHLDAPIHVSRPDTIVLGLGYATIVPENGVTAMKVDDVDGVRLAGFLVDAGPTNSDTLVQVGPPGSSADHADDPITVQDVFFRIGGAGPGKATRSLVVNADDTIVDHTWIWRADHGAGVGWDTNRADYGLVVNGDDVLATGLFVEHFNFYDVQWFGERGRTIFFQNEKSYDAPNQAAVDHDGIHGYAAYKVADSVDTHEAWGLGSYCYYNVDPSIRQDRGFAAPVKPGVKFHDLLVVSLSGHGQYNHVINDTGAPTSGTSTVPSNVLSYP